MLYANGINNSWSYNLDRLIYLSAENYANSRWGTQQGGFWDTQKWAPGDFNGDGKTDLACIYSYNGNACIQVHLSNGNSFDYCTGINPNPEWANQQGGFWDTQKWAPGDFNGDGKTDLACIYNYNGNTDIQVHLSNGTSFDYGSGINPNSQWA
jgi:hypothetical protein